jgi:hypothetical protein
MSVHGRSFLAGRCTGRRGQSILAMRYARMAEIRSQEYQKTSAASRPIESIKNGNINVCPDITASGRDIFKISKVNRFVIIVELTRQLGGNARFATG